MRGLLAVLFALLGCATIPVKDNPDIKLDGVKIKISNNRLDYASFYIVGRGVSHKIADLPGFDKDSVTIDRNWLPSDHNVRIAARILAVGDWISDPFYWSPGDVIEISLESLLVSSSAWPHP